MKRAVVSWRGFRAQCLDVPSAKRSTRYPKEILEAPLEAEIRIADKLFWPNGPFRDSDQLRVVGGQVGLGCVSHCGKLGGIPTSLEM